MHIKKTGAIAVFFLSASLYANAPYMFFQNSTRREATAVEADHVVHAAGCTAYYVQNTAGKVYLGSARHCFGMSAGNWCSRGGIFKDEEGNTGRCKRVVAADLKHDIVFLEADFKKAPKEAFRLAAYEPPVKSRLKMIGYPCDQYRKCKLTVTENCWVLKTGVPSPHSTMFDTSALHNCSTWGGNSGGPMVIEGQDAVVGLPFTYSPGNYTVRKSDEQSTAAHLAEMADFVKVHRAELEKAGIVIAD